MIIAKCENFDSDFEITIFPKDFEKYKDTEMLDRVVFVEGNLAINTEFERKSVLASKLNFLGITDFRMQVKESGYADGIKFNKFLQIANLSDEKKELESVKKGEKNDEKMEEKVEKIDKKVEKNEEKMFQNEIKSEEVLTEYVIVIPKNAKKEDLPDMKNFLL
jgi:DNA polymerase III alpha subunit